MRCVVNAENAHTRVSLEQIGIVIPTWNASRYWARMHAALEEQKISGAQILIIDSSSSDSTRELARRAGYRFKSIPQEKFQHGATRQLATGLLPFAKVIVYLTQDAILDGDRPVEHLIRAFDDPLVGAAYGRQLPREEAGCIEHHSRLFNYPDHSEVRDLASREKLGFRAAFFSNSFAAYRRVALEEVGGFPKDTIVSEDVSVAARMLLAGWRIAYRADANAIHSHDLTIRQEFSRFFDIGVHHGRSQWLIEQFGSARGEGYAFVTSQMRFLLRSGPALIPLALLRNVTKWCSYQLGLHEKSLPLTVKRAISGQPNYWRTEGKEMPSDEPVQGSAINLRARG